MYFAQITRQDIGCAAYLAGSTDAGEAAVIDPRIDMVDELIDLATREGLRIRFILETHNHADHVSGHHQLAARTGAVIAVHELAGAAYPHQPLHDGDILALGEVRLRIIHTPGHRPEHISIAAIDTSRSNDPWLVLTGDSLFIGDVARPDLAIPGVEGAEALFHSLHQQLLTLPEGTMAYPAHVSGSLCGRVSNRMTGTTIGFERRFNPALVIASQADFVRYMTESLPERPPNMARIVELNKGAEPPLVARAAPLTPEEVRQRQGEGALVLDIRSDHTFVSGHIPGAISVPLDGGQFQNRVGLLIPPEQRLILVADSDEQAADAALALSVIGYTSIAGYLAGGIECWKQVGYAEVPLASITVQQLREMQMNKASLQVLDVREPSEWNEEHLEGALHIPFYRLAANANLLDRERPIAVICGGGTRSIIASSVLHTQHITQVLNVTGGMDAWKAAHLPTVTEHMLTSGTY
jgi:hydroxyacylglutathione hydrolase